MDSGLAWPVSSEISSGLKSSQSDWMTVSRLLESANLSSRQAIDTTLCICFVKCISTNWSHLVPETGYGAVNWSQDETSRNVITLRMLANILIKALCGSRSPHPSSNSCCYTFSPALSHLIRLPGGTWFVALCIRYTALSR